MVGAASVMVTHTCHSGSFSPKRLLPPMARLVSQWTPSTQSTNYGLRPCRHSTLTRTLIPGSTKDTLEASSTFIAATAPPPEASHSQLPNNLSSSRRLHHGLSLSLPSSLLSSSLLYTASAQGTARHSTCPHRSTSQLSQGIDRSLYTSSRRLGPDPYSVLGVSHDAPSQDIKKRYRELAKQFHPDVNPGPEASAKMAAISSAYQILSDPKQKQFYDQTGMSPDEAGVNAQQAHGNPFTGGFGGGDPSFLFTDFTSFFTDAFGGRGTNAHVHKGDDMVTEVTLDFLEAANGCRKEIHLQGNSSCADCHGSGCAPGTSMTTCRACSGTGTQKIERGPIIFGTVCSRCNGNGQVVAHPCKGCKGSGTKSQSRAVDLDFPAGIRGGMELRISGQGHAGVRGGRAGDLFVKVNVRPHARFSLLQDDLHITVPLTLKQCLLGGEVIVPTLEGGTANSGGITLTVGPGTAPGEIRVLRGKGMKKVQDRGYGDIAVHWSLTMPKTLTERQKRIIEEFDQIQFGTDYQHQGKDGDHQTSTSYSRTSRSSSPAAAEVKQQSSAACGISAPSDGTVERTGSRSTPPLPPRPPSPRRTAASTSKQDLHDGAVPKTTESVSTTAGSGSGKSMSYHPHEDTVKEPEVMMPRRTGKVDTTSSSSSSSIREQHHLDDMRRQQQMSRVERGAERADLNPQGESLLGGSPQGHPQHAPYDKNKEDGEATAVIPDDGDRRLRASTSRTRSSSSTNGPSSSPSRSPSGTLGSSQGESTSRSSRFSPKNWFSKKHNMNN